MEKGKESGGVRDLAIAAEADVSADDLVTFDIDLVGDIVDDDLQDEERGLILIELNVTIRSSFDPDVAVEAVLGVDVHREGAVSVIVATETPHPTVSR